MRRIVGLVRTVTALTLTGVGVFAQSTSTHFGSDAAPVPRLEWTRYAAVYEVESDTLLYDLGGDEPWPPASLTKLVTLHVALDAIAANRLNLDRSAAVPEAAYFTSVPPDSSLMFLGPGQVVSLRDLLVGLGVASGNDAAVALALRLAGDVARFVARMNAIVARAGYPQFRFFDMSGLDARNRITAGDFARYTGSLLARYPLLADDLLSRRSIRHPEPRHYPNGATRMSPIVQTNRNGLLGTVTGVDGVKTGFIEASGYNFALSASRGGRRIVVVVLGIEAPNHTVGADRRERDALALLEWAYRAYRTRAVVAPRLEAARVWGATEDRVAVEAPGSVRLTLPPAAFDAIRARVVVREDALWAPLEPGTAVGELRYSVRDVEVASLPVVTATAVPRGGGFVRLLDGLSWWLRTRTQGD